jgi:hypothetical protein
LRIITGEAGAGKSALVTEFIHRAASIQTDLLISVGSCDAQTGPLDPYLPFREALTSLVLGSKGVSPVNLRSNISPPTPHREELLPPLGGRGGLSGRICLSRLNLPSASAKSPAALCWNKGRRCCPSLSRPQNCRASSTWPGRRVGRAKRPQPQVRVRPLTKAAFSSRGPRSCKR